MIGIPGGRLPGGIDEAARWSTVVVVCAAATAIPVAAATAILMAVAGVAARLLPLLATDAASRSLPYVGFGLAYSAARRLAGGRIRGSEAVALGAILGAAFSIRTVPHEGPMRVADIVALALCIGAPLGAACGGLSMALVLLASRDGGARSTASGFPAARRAAAGPQRPKVASPSAATSVSRTQPGIRIASTSSQATTTIEGA